MIKKSFMLYTASMGVVHRSSWQLFDFWQRRPLLFNPKLFNALLDRIIRVVVSFRWIFRITFRDVEFRNVLQDVSTRLIQRSGNDSVDSTCLVFEDFSFIPRQKSKELDSCSLRELSSVFLVHSCFLPRTNRIYFFFSLSAK